MARRALSLLPVLVVAASCSSVAGTPQAVPTTTTTTATTTTSSTPPTPSPGSAADGTDLTACVDSDCEVYVIGVTTIPIDPRFGFPSYVVTHEPSGRNRVDAEDPVNGNLHAYLDGTGHLEADDVRMEVVSTDATGAVLRFTPRAG